MIVALELWGRCVANKAEMGNFLQFYPRQSKVESSKSGLESVGCKRKRACWPILAPEQSFLPGQRLRNRDNEVGEEIGKDMVSQLSIAAPQTFRNSTPIFVYNSGSQKIPIGLSRNGLSLLCLTMCGSSTWRALWLEGTRKLGSRIT